MMQLLTEKEKKELTPYEQAKLYYRRDRKIFDLDFEELVSLYRRLGGYVLESEKSFAMLKLVHGSFSLDVMRNPYRVFDPKTANCIFCEQCAGNLLDVWKNIPTVFKERVKLFAGERRGKLRVLRMDDLKFVFDNHKKT